MAKDESTNSITEAILQRRTFLKIAVVAMVLYNLLASNNLLASKTKVKTELKPVAKRKPRYAIGMYVDGYDHMVGIYSILCQAINTGMIDDGIEIVVATTESKMYEKNNKLSSVSQRLMQWRDEGLIHKVIPVNNNIIIDKIHKTGLWEGVFNKLFFFNFTEYDKIIGLDCDILIRQNIGHWFDYETPIAIQAKNEIEWNSGAMVITPNSTLFNEMIDKLPQVQRLDHKKQKRNDTDGWNSGYGNQGFLSSFFTTSTDATQRMKTMPTEDAVLISSLQTQNMLYFWLHRNHIFSTIHLTTTKPWKARTKTRDPVACEVLREWALSVEGLENYELRKEYRNITSKTPPFLQDCPNATTPVIPAYQKFPRRYNL